MGQINVTGSVGAPPPPAPGDATTFTGTQIVYTPPSGGTAVTWNFASTVTWGRYWNGEPFVVSGGDTDIVITSISPASSETGGRKINGAIIQPDRYSKFVDSEDNNYNDSFNEDPGNTGQNLTVSATTYPTGATVMKGISRVTTTSLYKVAEYAALTIVPSVPPANAFRPPVVGTDKTSYYTTADVDMTLLKSVTPVTGQSAPSAGSAEGRTMMTWSPVNASNRTIYPTTYHNGYAAYQRERYCQWLLNLHADYTLADKQKVAWTLVQNGLDYIGAVDTKSWTWSPDSAHNDDAKVCAAFAAAMLGEASLRASNLNGGFQQDNDVFNVTQANIDAGAPFYTSAPNFRPGTGCQLDAAWLNRGFWQLHFRDPNNDAGYRWIHHNAAACEALGLLMIGTGEGKTAWENDAFFDLGAQIGLMQRENQNVGTRTIEDWQIAFLGAHQDTYYTADVLPEPPHSISLSVSGSTVTVTLDGTNLYIGSGTYVRTEARWSTDRTNWTTVTLGAASGGAITGVTTGATVYVQARRVSSVGAGPWTTNHIRKDNEDFDNVLISAGKLVGDYRSAGYRDACDDTYEAVSGFEAITEAEVNGVIRT